MLLPTSCPVCRRVGPAPCLACLARCRRAAPFPAPPGLDGCHALLVYEGAARELVARLKYRNARSSVAWLAGGMARLVDPAGIDVVTWAPTTVRRRRDRGFDQAEVLARGVARCLGRPARGWLRRVAGPAQTGRAVEERWHGPRFDPTGVAVAQAARVLVVDDVVTTGASLAGAGRALRSAGAAAVIGLAAAWTPPARRRATS